VSDDAFFAINDKEIVNWIAKDEGVGARCQGVVVATERWTSSYDDGLVPVVYVDPRDRDDVLSRVVGFDTVLRRELEGVGAGSLIDIKYLGTAEGARGEYASYRVMVRKVVSESPEAAAAEKVDEVRQIAKRWADDHPDPDAADDDLDEPF
jgi:hypothetical protein